MRRGSKKLHEDYYEAIFNDDHLTLFLVQYTQTAMWISAHACTSYVVFITVFWYRDGMPGPLGGSLYAGFHRVVFTLGLFWLIYACLHGMARE